MLSTRDIIGMQKHKSFQSIKVKKLTPCKHLPVENLWVLVILGEMDIKTSNAGAPGWLNMFKRKLQLMS